MKRNHQSSNQTAVSCCLCWWTCTMLQFQDPIEGWQWHPIFRVGASFISDGRELCYLNLTACSWRSIFLARNRAGFWLSIGTQQPGAVTTLDATTTPAQRETSRFHLRGATEILWEALKNRADVNQILVCFCCCRSWLPLKGRHLSCNICFSTAGAMIIAATEWI